MISQTANAACSIAYRNVVNAVIPKALWNDIYMGCRRLAAGEGKSIEQGRANLLEWIKTIGVKPVELFHFLAVEGISDVTLSHMELLAGIRTSLGEGECTVDEVFRPVEPSTTEKSQQSALLDKLKSRQANGNIKDRHPPVAETVAEPMPAPGPADSVPDVPKSEPAAESEVKVWIVDGLKAVNEMLLAKDAHAKTVHPNQVIYHVLKESIAFGTTKEDALNLPDGKRDVLKVAAEINRLWADQNQWVRDVAQDYMVDLVPDPAGLA
jgi:hypothetical protein